MTDHTNHKSEAHIQQRQHERSAGHKLSAHVTEMLHQCKDFSSMRAPQQSASMINEQFGKLTIQGDGSSDTSKARTIRRGPDDELFSDGGKVPIRRQ